MEQQLFWKLLEPEHADANRFCRRLTGNDPDGDDLYQDGLLAALQRFHTLRESSAFRPWLYRILINRFRNDRRWHKRHQTEELIPEVMTDHATNPTGELTARRWLERAFAALKPNERAIVVLFELEGWTVNELAQSLQKPTGTIKAKLARSRRKMRRAIEKHLPPQPNESIAGKAGYAFPKEPE